MKNGKQILALVLGGATKVFVEAEQAFNDYDIDVVLAINNCMKDYPGEIDAAVTLHPSKLAEWLDNRKAPNTPKHIVSFKERDKVTHVIDYMWPQMTKSGSSGLYAVKVAFELFQADKVILAGVPMTADAHYHDNKPWGEPKDFREAWLQMMPTLMGKVKSYGGWTAEHLGLPSREWVNG